ncbi:MAG: glycosyltransferase [Cryomorphaceae bacterium]|nr:MAG: glycosyltransferase [Cryomorphaceae bacterium]
MKLSVVIVNYNVAFFLEQCLQSVARAMKGLETEVWVVDNNSVDGSVAMVRERFPWVKLIESRENLGFSRGNNLAIRQSTGQYVLLLNPDTVLEEDTFRKVVDFMDTHPEAGGLGVKMIDGKGAFLPESKRGLPTPAVAFYKIFGLSALFPRSKRFGRYHLGYLSNDEVHEIEVLSGAFMLMRKEALDKVGLLDEDFFMYGEDIDLSWRLILGGYKNYYFPHTRIIHYKGESTKKSSINYVFVFYRAMVIFARKHFSERNVKTFSFLINLAIYFRASLAILNRFAQRAALPVLDVLAILGVLFLSKMWYQQLAHIDLSDSIVHIALPAYALLLVISLYLSSAYERPLKWLNLVKGVLVGSAIILLAYSLLPESLRFSRALTVLGSLAALPTVLLLRGIYHMAGIPKNLFAARRALRCAVVGLHDEAERVSNLLQQSGQETELTIHVQPSGDERPTTSTISLSQLHSAVEVHKLHMVIFCARDLSAQEIISNMASLHGEELEFKIAPPESLYIIGSKSVEGPGELFVFEVNSISKNANRRNKRLFDIATSIVLLLLSPLLMWIQHKPLGYIKNAWWVLIGKKTWVGFYPHTQQKLPPLRPGVLSPAHHLQPSARTNDTIGRLNLVYAKDYRMKTDLRLITSHFRKLGGKK